jgi:S1-C subfamily serine protease
MALSRSFMAGDYLCTVFCACLVAMGIWSHVPKILSAAGQVESKNLPSENKTYLEKDGNVLDVLRVARNSIVRIEAEWRLHDWNGKDDRAAIHDKSLPPGQVGSGFIFDKGGYVLTNAHVVTPPEGWFVDSPTKVFQQDTQSHKGTPPAGWVGLALNLFVGFPVDLVLPIPVPEHRGELVLLTAQLVGVDHRSDLAVLKIESLKGLPALSFEFSPDLGEDVVAVGFARGESRDHLSWPTITKGIIGAIDRTTDDGAFTGMVQTDAALNSGNSGGPLLNMRGKVVGVNTSGFPSQVLGALTPRPRLDLAHGIYYARSSSTARNFADRIIKEGRVRRASLGLRKVVPVTVLVQNPDQQSSVRKNAVMILEFDPNSSAAKSGLETYDIVYRIVGPLNKGMPTLSFISVPGNLNDLLADVEPGDRVRVGFFRYRPERIKGFRLDQPIVVSFADQEQARCSREVSTTNEME